MRADSKTQPGANPKAAIAAAEVADVSVSVADFDPARDIPRWDRMPEHVRAIRLAAMGRNPDGTPMQATAEPAAAEVATVTVPGIREPIPLDRAVALRDALDAVLAETEKTQ
jgi:hypothetical protein